MNKVRGKKKKKAGPASTGHPSTSLRINLRGGSASASHPSTSLRINQRSLGFTLIELIITAGVLIIIMGAATGAGVGRKTQFNLSVNQEKLRALISRAKGLSLNSLIKQGSNICGYGVHITYNKAIIFADKSESGCGNSDHKYSGVSENFIGGFNEVVLDSSIYFSGDSFVKDVGLSIDVLFAPPDPTTYINGSEGTNLQTIIGIANSSNSFRKVIVKGTGLINMSY